MAYAGEPLCSALLALARHTRTSFSDESVSGSILVVLPLFEYLASSEVSLQCERNII